MSDVDKSNYKCDKYYTLNHKNCRPKYKYCTNYTNVHLLRTKQQVQHIKLQDLYSELHTYTLQTNFVNESITTSVLLARSSEKSTFMSIRHVCSLATCFGRFLHVDRLIADS